MPSGTPASAASTNPPSTRHTVIPTSSAKPCFANSAQPSASIVSGSARNVLETSPENVAALHAATNSTKNATPSATLRARLTGTSGFTGLWVGLQPGVAPPRLSA